MPASIQVNGIPSLSGKIFEPRVGTWYANVELDAEELPTGLVTLSFFETHEFTGTVTSARSVADEGRVKLRIDGGGGNLDQPIEPRHFQNASAQSIVRDVTTQTGDTIAAASQLSQRYRHWTRPRTIAHAEIQSVAEALGYAWRILRDGTLWIGPETWPEASGKNIEQTKVGGGVVIYPDEGPFVQPGTTFNGQRVAEVMTSWGPDGSHPLTQQIAYEDSDTTVTPHTRSIQADVVDWFERTNGVKLKLSAFYPCRVVGQSSDLERVDLQPEDPSIKAQGLQGVPIRYGMPGIKCTLKKGAQNGARVMLGFDGADPDKPFAAICDRAGVLKVHVEPDADGNVEIATTGNGVIRIESESSVQLISPDVRLGSTSGLDVACKGDLVVGNVEPMFYLTPAGVPAPVISAAGLPTIGFAGQIARGRPGVKAG